MLEQLQARNFRCFDSLGLELEAGFNFFVGQNGQGKTSILEAACALLRLQSQRSASLAPLVRMGQPGFALRGKFDHHALEFRYRTLRRTLRFDEVEQRNAGEYLRLARVVSLANADIEMVRGSAEPRRRYLDFLGAQTDPAYRPTLRSYERALRARNALLKSPQASAREQLAAYTPTLLKHGAALARLRAALVARLAPLAAEAHRQISGTEERVEMRYLPGASGNFAEALAQSRAEELRLRLTIIGPHRDDLGFTISGLAAAQFASEGQQRTLALALKIAQARSFAAEQETPPLLLIDDIFGELDPARRNALLAHLPASAQKFVTATSLRWMEEKIAGPVFQVRHGEVERGG